MLFQFMILIIYSGNLMNLLADLFDQIVINVLIVLIKSFALQSS